MTTLRRCPGHRCPHLVPAGQRCPTHQAEYESRRGTSTRRGYGTRHQTLRAKVAPQVAEGRTLCARCGNTIRPDEPWDLGHDDNNRQRYNGPEHAHCNRSAGGKRGRATQD